MAEVSVPTPPAEKPAAPTGFHVPPLRRRTVALPAYFPSQYATQGAPSGASERLVEDALEGVKPASLPANQTAAMLGVSAGVVNVVLTGVSWSAAPSSAVKQTV